MNSLKTWLAIIFGVAFLRIGLLHFTQPEPFDAIIPPYLPFPRFWTLASGILEILLGLGLMLPKMRQRAALCMALLLVLMYQANLNMWVHDIPFGQTRFETRGHIVRLLIQIILILGCLWISRRLKGARAQATDAET